jgi:hypothetical protein
MSARYTQLGRVLPLVARAVLRTVFPDLDPSEADYNFVQNNGKATILPNLVSASFPPPYVNQGLISLLHAPTGLAIA